MSFVRVITPTITFYPPDSQQQDDRTINGILNFITSSMGCHLQYFRTNNQTIVFSYWNQILFIVSGVNESVAYLRFRLQIIREIAVFLFGLDFDQIMRKSTINVNFIDLYAKYVDEFLKMTENDYYTQLGLISHNSYFSEFSNYLSESIPSSQFPHDLPFIDCFILKNHKIVSRLNLANQNPINYMSVYILSLFSRIEYPDTDSAKPNRKEKESDPEESKSKDVSNTEINNNDNNQESSYEKQYKLFDPNYVNITDPPSVQLRAGYITIGETSCLCSISSTLLGPNSPYVALFITQELNTDVKKFIVSGIISLISSSMSEAVRLILTPLSFNFPGLVYFLAANRSSGECFDFESCGDVKSHHITNLLFRTMKNYTFEALFNGQTTFIWRDSHFLFVYSIFFIQSDGKAVNPPEKVKIPIFKNDFNLTYQTICNEFFHKEKNLKVYEVYSIFLGVVPPQAAYCETVDMFIDVIKEKKIIFTGNVDVLKASLLPHSKKNRNSLLNS